MAAYVKQEQIDQGDIDGTNREFETSVAYLPGTVRLFDPLWTSPDFVEELGGTSVRLAEPPLPGDVWILYYSHA